MAQLNPDDQLRQNRFFGLPQGVGSANKAATPQQIALKALDEFYNNGLFTVSLCNGAYVVTKTKLSVETYETARENIVRLTPDGYGPNGVLARDAMLRHARIMR